MDDTPYQASYDALAIVGYLEEPFGGMTEGEIHLLAYLACLLAVYRGRPAADWGYRFVRSSWGAPYSVNLSNALSEMHVGALLAGEGAWKLTEDGKQFLEFLSRRAEHSWRTPFLEGATGSALAIPSGIIRDALRGEPGLRASALHAGARLLLDDGAIAGLHEHFSALSEAVGPDLDDLMIPSVVWIRYLVEIRDAEENRSVQTASDRSFAPKGVTQ